MAAPYDVRVVFTKEEDEGNYNKDGGRSMPGCSLLLSARSEFFRSALTWNSQDGDSRPNKRQRKDEGDQTSAREQIGENAHEPGAEDIPQGSHLPKGVVLVFEDQEDLIAGKSIIQLIQDLALPPDMRAPCPPGDLTSGLLAKMLRWSDYLGSSECVQACVDLLPKLDQAKLQLNDAIQLMNLPHSIVSMPAFSKVEDFCKGTLLHAFSDALKGVMSAQLREQFCSLPFPAVKLFSSLYKKLPEWEGYKSRQANLAYLLASWVTSAQRQERDGHEPAQVAGLLSWTDMNLLSMLRTEAFAKIKPVCSKCLLSSFGDVHRVIVDAELLSSFCSLAFPLIEIWAGLDELVGNENDVAVLLTPWSKSRSLSEDQLKRLSSLLRVGQLTRSYRWYVLPKQDQIKLPFDLQEFNLAYEECMSAGVSVGNAFQWGSSRPPPAWLAPPRSGVLPAGAQNRSVFTVSFSLSTLSDLLAMAESTKQSASACSESLYAGGFFWYVSLSFNPAEGSLGVFLKLKAKEGLPAPHVAAVVYSICHLANDGSLSTIISSLDGPRFIKALGGKGRCNAFPGLKFTSPAVLDKVLHAGQLVLKVQISDVK